MLLRHAKTQVLVVGAGPVGMFAALWLHKLGIKARIVDEARSSATHSYALALHPRSLELMDELGVAGAVLERARRVDTIGLYDGLERRGEIKLSNLPTEFPFLAILPQSGLEEVLAQNLAKQKTAVEWSHRLAQLSPGAESVTATIHTLEKESTGYAVMHTETVVAKSRDIEVPFVLGADGHHSLVRRQLGIAFDSVTPDEHFVVLEFTPDASLTDEVRVVLDSATTNVLWPMPGNRYRWTIQSPGGAVHETRDKDRLLVQVGEQVFPQVEPELANRWLSQRAPWFHSHIGDPHWQAAVRFEHRIASAFGRSRVWLAGDAGHLTGPVGAQSMNVGFREAADLCNLYAGILDKGVPLNALQVYGEERAAEWRELLGMGAPLEAAPGASPWVAERSSRLLSCIPASGAHLEAALRQLGLRARA
jgi:2-polyprenyl-6-methoxyphenol hydroxylase-like FAD-dependent oxidoreductase